MLQPGGIDGSSGNRDSRNSRSLSLGQAEPNKAAALLPWRNSSGATKQPFQSPLRLSLAPVSSALNLSVASDSKSSAYPRRTSDWFKLVVSPSTVQIPLCHLG